LVELVFLCMPAPLSAGRSPRRGGKADHLLERFFEFDDFLIASGIILSFVDLCRSAGFSCAHRGATGSIGYAGAEDAAWFAYPGRAPGGGVAGRSKAASELGRSRETCDTNRQNL
jgi:hypothetical protein